MNEKDALLSAIAANPDDDTARLVYADWLDEHDDAPRAEFIRLQIELTRDDGSMPGAQYVDKLRRANALLDQHEKEWVPEFLQGDSGSAFGSPEFRRGFIDKVTFQCPSLLRADEGGQVMKMVPPPRAAVMANPAIGHGSFTQALEKATWLQSLRELEIIGPMGQEHAEALSRTPNLRNVVHLTLKPGADEAIALQMMQDMVTDAFDRMMRTTLNGPLDAPDSTERNFRTLETLNLTGDFPTLTVQPYLPGRTPQTLTAVDVGDAAMGPDELAGMLAEMPNLRSFRYGRNFTLLAPMPPETLQPHVGQWTELGLYSDATIVPNGAVLEQNVRALTKAVTNGAVRKLGYHGSDGTATMINWMREAGGKCTRFHWTFAIERKEGLMEALHDLAQQHPDAVFTLHNIYYGVFKDHPGFDRRIHSVVLTGAEVMAVLEQNVSVQNVTQGKTTQLGTS